MFQITSIFGRLSKDRVGKLAPIDASLFADFGCWAEKPSTMICFEEFGNQL